jgi:pimeloyl-ACP methyl ester carboxylesterase
VVHLPRKYWSNIMRDPHDRRGRRFPIFPGALALALAVAAAARADLLIFKDGHIAQGKVVRQSVVEFDPQTRESFTVPKGFMLLDDGPRRLYFSPTQVRIAERMPAPAEERILHGRRWPIAQPKNLPPILEVLDPGEWDPVKWTRTFTFRAASGSRRVPQHLYLITPSHAVVDCTKVYWWTCAYLTRELGAETVYNLLRSHSNLQDVPKKPADTAARRFRIIDFLGQAGWFDLANKELDRLAKDLPDQKNRVAAARKTLRSLAATERFEQIKRWDYAGRHTIVRKALADFSEKDAPEKLRAALRVRKSDYERTTARLTLADRLLESCAREVTDKVHKPLAAAAGVIRTELHPWGVERLDAFLGQAAQAERQRAAAGKPMKTPAQLLALAVSGWLLGSPAAEDNPKAAINLWRTRLLVQEYQQTADADARQKLLDDYLKTVTPRVELDEVAQLIPHLPPPEPGVAVGSVPIERKVELGRRGLTYQVQLPPEYSHHRPYPLVLLLHDTGETPRAVLDRWAPAAADNGLILAALAWQNGLGGYGFTEAEHEAVLRTLRDLRQRYRIDSDRVFLFGQGEGGTMAFDVALAHPGQFAGLMTMGAGPSLFPARCWRNAQYLPVYAVNGTKAGDSTKQLHAQFTYWIRHHYPALWVEYKQRGREWFGGELPNMTDWMRRQRRLFPMRQLGHDGGGGPFGNEFQTLRAENNRFYWLSTSDVMPRNVVTPERWKNSVPPASLTGRIDPVGNDIQLRVSGVRKVTVWLGRNARGQYMVDLEKPLTVRVGFGVRVNRRLVRPSLKVLLEDLHERGDRQQLFVAKVDVDVR